MYHNYWSAFNFILSENINPNINEQLFETKVIQAFSELGWKEFMGNIEVRPTLHIGSVNRIEPDLLFKSDDLKKLFVVEVKRPNVELASDHKKQLFSYMRQLKLEYGILIGSEIQIYYDGNLKNHDAPILLERIMFEKDSVKGLKFVELFNKTDFTYERLNDYTSNIIKDINNKQQSKVLVKTILSDDFKDVLKGLIKGHFSKEHNSETIDLALDKLTIEISCIKEHSSPIIKQAQSIALSTYAPKPNSSEYSDKRMKDGVKIGEFVQRTFRRLMSENKLSSNEINNLLRDDYSKSVFGQSRKVLRYTSEGTQDNLGNDRYYKKEIFGGKYYLTSQWVEKQWDPFLNWLKIIDNKI